MNRLSWASICILIASLAPALLHAGSDDGYDADVWFQNFRHLTYHCTTPSLRAVDDNMGRLLDALEAAGIADDTLVIFFGDNGGPPETGANNGPLMGSKYNVFEGGIRVPFFLRWPGRLPAGSIYPYVVSSLDVVPTALDAALAANVPSDLDGVSLIDPVVAGTPTVEDPSAPGQDGRTLYWRWLRSNWAIRKGPWKLVDSAIGRSGTFTNEVWFDSGIVNKKSLFKLDDSPSESVGNDRISTNSAKAAELEALVNAWKNSL